MELGRTWQHFSPGTISLSVPKWVHFKWSFFPPAMEQRGFPLASDSSAVFSGGLDQVSCHYHVQLEGGEETNIPTEDGL